MTIVSRVTLADAQFTDAAELFDEYRQHYGANPAPEAVEDWLRDQLVHDRLRAICTVAVVPASLTLRTVWLVRDLYVDPDARRGGLARALIAQVADDARAAGAHRLSLQTEADNTRALDLYARASFEPVTDIVLLNRVL